MSIEVGSPVPGLAAPISEVPDPVFSQAMVGPGVAVKPEPGSADAVAPIAGTVATLHPHAFVVAAPGGTAVLVHLGIDTVKLKGEGFTLHVAKGDVVEAGQRIVTWNPTEVESHGYSSVCPVVALDVAPEALSDLREDGRVEAGDALFAVSG
ncbi:PTS system N-acetylglucosamine-specific IIA component (Glc family) [Saccharopolyspora erythraea NRRL 2338]|uniref:PTS system, glucose-specific component n=2 Tax=Saccharopolyspora erythraea TaxID=1836 RepID=A4FBE3_SACEN|nr:PTS glucose transporter subunit IIA [Saccharopolyspora erythraea]EQD81534.1 PTS glucose transporter subunit IIA [Saccharopolyspora erythraea D]PFG95150.1 PTS system N-acetylglucosamine-specific IIA component (Glc family) [Saccharopolyspora erythraea NRRL 2338]QRK91819.1 PTS glucose transporter subunit IIA [Saccharopolyspora erythraea]CAM01368.1 PTS system, glucose-specific component [Saccharopolyspora erythraea NRRL 2338]